MYLFIYCITTQVQNGIFDRFDRYRWYTFKTVKILTFEGQGRSWTDKEGLVWSRLAF